MSFVNTNVSPFDGEALEESAPRCRLMEKYFTLFPSRLESGVKRETEATWRFMSKYHTLSDLEVEQSLEKDANLLRAFSVEAKSDFLVVSFAEKSTYHSAAFVTNIMSALKARGIKTCLYEFHGDWFLFLYFGVQIETTPFCELFANWCETLGMKTGAEGICIHDVGSLVPFPVQSGFYWLNERCQKLVKREELSLEKSLFFLISEAAKQKNDPDVFKNTFKISALSKRSKLLQAPVAAVVEVSSVSASTISDQAQIIEGNAKDFSVPQDEAVSVQLSAADQSAIEDAVEEATASNVTMPATSVQLAS
ncbi:MAG: hypothetical protein K2X77_25695 [Candidatus Obscuribacterales bacterium]|nr:hypothetical protein [Candidatus Obscuribacterales bacterium]